MAAWTAFTAPSTDASDWQGTVYSGKAYLTLGYDGVSTGIAAVQEYNPGSDTWAVKTACPTPFAFGTSGLVGSKWYHFGGFDFGGNTDVARSLVYDIVGDTWTSIANMDHPSDSSAAVAVGTKIYIFGGFDGDGSTLCARTRIYDTVGNSWSSGANMPALLGQPSVSTDGTYIYIFGGFLVGFAAGTADSNVIYRYNISGNSWSSVDTLWTPCEGPATTVVGAYTYILAGLYYNGTITVVKNQVGAWKSDLTHYQDTDYPGADFGIVFVNIGGVIYSFDRSRYYSLVPNPQSGWPGTGGSVPSLEYLDATASVHPFGVFLAFEQAPVVTTPAQNSSSVTNTQITARRGYYKSAGTVRIR